MVEAQYTLRNVKQRQKRIDSPRYARVNIAATDLSRVRLEPLSYTSTLTIHASLYL